MRELCEQCFEKITKEVVSKDGKLSLEDIEAIKGFIGALEIIKDATIGINAFEKLKKAVEEESKA